MHGVPQLPAFPESCARIVSSSRRWLSRGPAALRGGFLRPSVVCRPVLSRVNTPEQLRRVAAQLRPVFRQRGYDVRLEELGPESATGTTVTSNGETTVVDDPGANDSIAPGGAVTRGRASTHWWRSLSVRTPAAFRGSTSGCCSRLSRRPSCRGERRYYIRSLEPTSRVRSLDVQGAMLGVLGSTIWVSTPGPHHERRREPPVLRSRSLRISARWPRSSTSVDACPTGRRCSISAWPARWPASLRRRSSRSSASRSNR